MYSNKSTSGNSSTIAKSISYIFRNISVLDASSKLQSGMALGNIINLGSFEECMGVYYKNNSEIRGKYCLYGLLLHLTKEEIIPHFVVKMSLQRYSLSTINLFFSFIKKIFCYTFYANIISYIFQADINIVKRHIGNRSLGIPLIEAMCIPNSCTTEDLYEIYDISGLKKNFPYVEPIFMEQYCQPEENFVRFSYLEWFAV